MVFDIINLIFVALLISSLQSCIESQILDSTCGPLELENANVTITKSRNLAEIKCNKNYSFDQESRNVYCFNRKWDLRGAPLCIHDDCKNNALYHNIKNGKTLLKFSPVRGKIRLYYGCNENYTLKGPSVAECMNGKWSIYPPQCIENRTPNFQPKDSKCKPLEIQNAKIILNQQGDIATVECNSNYSLIGNSTLHCVNEVWKAYDNPMCIHNGCLNSSLHYDIANGEVVQQSFEGNGQVILVYDCNENYELKYEKTFFCYDGTWYHDPPVCELKPTQQLGSNCEPFEYRKAQVVLNEKKDTATVICNKNYFLHRGNSTFYCINGQWEQDDYPLCIHINCKEEEIRKYRSIENGELEVSFKIYGEASLFYICNDNYTLVGSESSMCFDGEFYNDLPICVLYEEYDDDDYTNGDDQLNKF